VKFSPEYQPANPHGFKKGVSGNPAGQPKGVIRQLREKHREDLPKLMQAAVDIALDKEAKGSDRLKAVELVFDRLLGKPKQSIDLTGDVTAGPSINMAPLTVEQLQALAALDVQSEDGDGRDGDTGSSTH
jgi:hypothetical protein